MRLHIDLVRRGVGDTVALTGLVRDLVTNRPDIRISVAGNCADQVFRNDPNYVPGSDPSGADRVVRLDYKPTIDRAKRGDRTARYAYAAHDAYEAETGLVVSRGPPCPVLRPDPGGPVFDHPYAVLACGVKQDIPVKQAPMALFSDVVRRTAGLRWKQVGLVHDGRLAHRQTPVPGADDLVGTTNLRKLVRIIAGARVVLCHVSLPMMIASAVGVPCVVLAGGREDPSLFDDLGATLLHTIGRLDCCATGGCYAACALTDRRPDEFPRGWLCRRPIALVGERPVGECMTLISADLVVESIRSVVG